MADRKHLLHVKSNVAETAEQYGIDKFLVTPKKPVDSTTGKATDDTLLYGEIAVNYGKGVEALIIRNTEDNVVAFVNENDFYEAGKIASDGLATEKMEREESVAAEAVARDQAIAAEKLAREQADMAEANERAQAIDAEASARDQAFNYLDKKIDTSAVLSMVSITYAKMKELRDQSKLKAGQLYRITDYVTTTMQPNTQSAGHVFDVIVLATDANTLNENAKVIKHEGDTYFANSNLDAWEIKYDLDNVKTKYGWADETNGKGVIFYMKDELNNECPYDFKNIQFKRWAVTEVQNSKLDSENLKHLQDIFVFNEDGTKFTTRFGYKDSNCIYGETTHVVNSNDYNWYYTFSTIKFENNMYAWADIEDASIKANNFYNDEDGSGCLGNSIKPYYDNNVSDYNSNDINGTQYLNNIVFNGFYASGEHGFAYHCLNNSFGYNSLNNTFGDNCINNTFGNFCDDNTFGSTCYGNTFGENCNSNTFVGYCFYNTFGNTCDNNTFGHNCFGHTFGINCSGNTFANNCSDNTFGKGCGQNTFGTKCYGNTFGNYCNSNTFVSNCTKNIFGNDCSENIFGDGCDSNIFGNTCKSNTFGTGCYSNIFWNAGLRNTFGTGCYSNIFGNYGLDQTFGNNCYGNTFGNYCIKNTFGNYCIKNTFGNNVQHIEFVKDYMDYNTIENGNTYITVTSDVTTSSVYHLRNITIAQGVNNTTTVKSISHKTANNTFKTIYQNAASRAVSV